MRDGLVPLAPGSHFPADSVRYRMYQRPRLERYGTFRELTQVSVSLGALALNGNIVNGTAASCDCIPGEPPPGGTRS